MVGFIKGIFSKKPAKETAQAAPESAPKPAPKPVEAAPKEKVVRQKPVRENAARAEAYFLDADQAQSLGNLEYMRMAKSVKRTFAKTVGNPDIKPLIQSVSATQRSVGASAAPVNPNAGSFTPDTKVPTKDEAIERRRADSSMDMFRNMARDIKKK